MAFFRCGWDRAEFRQEREGLVRIPLGVNGIGENFLREQKQIAGISSRVEGIRWNSLTSLWDWLEFFREGTGFVRIPSGLGGID